MTASDPRYPVSQEDSMLPVLRAMVEAFHAMTQVGNRNIEALGVTPAQFDVLAVLGDTPGMTCKELGQRALVSGGTLTPVLDRLESRGLVKRAKCEQDGRQIITSLTPEGQALYELTFLPHIDFMRSFLNKLTQEEQEQLIGLMKKLKEAFSTPQGAATHG